MTSFFLLFFSDYSIHVVLQKRYSQVLSILPIDCSRFDIYLTVYMCLPAFEAGVLEVKYSLKMVSWPETEVDKVRIYYVHGS